MVTTPEDSMPNDETMAQRGKRIMGVSAKLAAAFLSVNQTKARRPKATRKPAR